MKSLIHRRPIGVDQILIERVALSGKCWKWRLVQGESTLVEAPQGYANAEEAYEAARHYIKYEWAENWPTAFPEEN